MSESILLSLKALRSDGAQRFDPTRFHYMEVLSQRMQAQPVEVQRILTGKLNEALADYVERLKQAPQATNKNVATQPNTGCAPLTELNHYIQNLTQDGSDSPLSHAGCSPTEMKSVGRFREVWSRISAEDQVNQAIGRGPENAGPLNSHMLVLRSLSLMRKLSPDYLRRFLSQADSLLWLEQVNQEYTLKESKPARRGKQKK